MHNPCSLEGKENSQSNNILHGSMEQHQHATKGKSYTCTSEHGGHLRKPSLLENHHRLFISKVCAPSTIILRLIFVLRASREFPFPCVCGSYRKVGHVTCRKLSSCFFKKKEKRAVGDTHMLAKPRMSRFLLLLRQPTTEQPSSVTDKP